MGEEDSAGLLGCAACVVLRLSCARLQGCNPCQPRMLANEEQAPHVHAVRAPEVILQVLLKVLPISGIVRLSRGLRRCVQALKVFSIASV